MLIPNKNLDLQNSPIEFSAILLKEYSGEDIDFKTIQDKFSKIYDDQYWIILIRALNFLFLSGKIEYEIITDRIKFK